MIEGRGNDFCTGTPNAEALNELTDYLLEFIVEEEPELQGAETAKKK